MGDFICVTLNDKLQPIHRQRVEDSLDKFLEKYQIGYVSGGGTLQGKDGEIIECDIDIEASNTSEKAIQRIIAFLEMAQAPKGSKLRIGERIIPFGNSENMKDWRSI